MCNFNQLFFNLRTDLSKLKIAAKQVSKQSWMIVATVLSCDFVKVRDRQVNSRNLVHDLRQLLLIMVDGSPDIRFARLS